MTTFRRDAVQPSHATGNGGRLPDDDVSRCQLRDVEGLEARCQTCAATRYCSCCSGQPPTVYTQRVADV